MIAITDHTFLHLGGCGYGRSHQVPVWMFHRAGCAMTFYFLPNRPMGQYFKAVNTDKQEFVCPWCIGGGAKLWEWAANPQGALFTLLLRQSDAGGGGDFFGYSLRAIDHWSNDDRDHQEPRYETISPGVSEGERVQPSPGQMVGRWAGDRVLLIGDYDSSKLYDEACGYRNISEPLVKEWNAFIGLPNLKISFHRCSSCSLETGQ